jgi:hypothetical protein
MTITERIAAAVKPIIDDHNRESRERIGQLERDINETRAHLEVARTTCERLTKQAPPTQQDGPWCVIGEAGGLRVARVAILCWQVAEARVFANVSDAEAAALVAWQERAPVDHIQVVTVAEWCAMPKVLK